MNRGENSDSIPMDLILDILSRLPAKSVVRFRCVSKLWESMLCQPYFTELFLTRSSACPRLLLGIVQDGEWLFYSSPQPHNPYEKSSLVVPADFHMKFYKEAYPYDCSYASGLIYFPSMRISKEDDYAERVICNPSTGQYVILPHKVIKYVRHGFLGFDPIDKEFKVLVVNDNFINYDLVYHILTLGTEKLRFEKFEFEVVHLKPDCIYELINYKGKLGVIDLDYADDGGFPLKLCMSVLEDIKKRKWSTYVYTLSSENQVFKVEYNLFVVGMTASGEIVLAKQKATKPFYVFYFNPERNTLLSVEIQGVGKKEEWSNNRIVYAYVDHVEDPKFNIMKTTYAATSISPPMRKQTSTSTSSRKDHQVSTSTSFRKDNQLRTVAYRQQDRRTFESPNKFNALCLFDDD